MRVRGWILHGALAVAVLGGSLQVLAQAPPPGPPIRILPPVGPAPKEPPPGPTTPAAKPLGPDATPEQRVDGAIEHLVEIKDTLANPPPLPPPDPTRPEDDQLRADRERYQRHFEALACLLAMYDLVFDLERAGRRAYGADPRKLEQFRKKLAEFEAAKGTPQEQADLVQKAIDHNFRGWRRLYFGYLREDWFHDLYHLANTKKVTEGTALGLGAFWSPLKVWTGLDCQGAECREQSEVERQRLQRTQPR
jgi:hypothetical protein